MNRFNEMMATHFKGYECVYVMRDENRSRDLRVFNVGHAEVVGLSDGTDAWMASASGALNGRLYQTMLANTTGVRPRAKTNRTDAAPDAAAAQEHFPRRRVTLRV